MSKKLIAVASASALALSVLVGIAPAHATPTIDYTDVGSGAGTAAAPYTAPVPSANTLANGVNVLKIDVDSLGVGDTATVAISGTAKVVGAENTAASTNVNVTTLGASSLTKTVSSGTELLFYVYSTSTAANSTVTVTVNKTSAGTKSTTTSTKYFKATSTIKHNVTNIVAPATMAAGADGEVTFKITDVFGNELGASGDTLAAALSASAGTTDGIATYDTTRKVWVAELTAPANTRAFILTIDGNGGTSSDGPSNTGVGASTVDNNVVTVNATGVASQITTLTAQVAALQVIVDRKVTKKRFNTLARKWNAAFPSQAVKLKK
jgi:hypothetical protein